MQDAASLDNTCEWADALVLVHDLTRPNTAQEVLQLAAGLSDLSNGLSPKLFMVGTKLDLALARSIIPASDMACDPGAACDHFCSRLSVAEERQKVMDFFNMVIRETIAAQQKKTGSLSRALGSLFNKRREMAGLSHATKKNSN